MERWHINVFCSKKSTIKIIRANALSLDGLPNGIYCKGKENSTQREVIW